MALGGVTCVIQFTVLKNLMKVGHSIPAKVAKHKEVKELVKGHSIAQSTASVPAS